MKRKLIITKDNSNSIFVSELDEHYHSVHGALQESELVFIQNGLRFCKKTHINILEAGFGTGLNALLTIKAIQGSNINIDYTSIEKYPVDTTMALKLNYPELTGISKDIFMKMHECLPDKEHEITANFHLTKLYEDIKDIPVRKKYDLVYFDAFAPDKQPELWTETVFENIYRQMNTGSVLVTYSAKGVVKRALRAAGFTVKRLPGPPGKHHVLRALV